jgi:hypothetical protein
MDSDENLGARFNPAGLAYSFILFWLKRKLH